MRTEVAVKGPLGRLLRGPWLPWLAGPSKEFADLVPKAAAASTSQEDER